jgi:hypothetical protein
MHHMDAIRQYKCKEEELNRTLWSYFADKA